MIFTPNQPPPLHADPTSIPQFCVICNFSARSIPVRCMTAAIQPIIAINSNDGLQFYWSDFTALEQ